MQKLELSNSFRAIILVAKWSCLINVSTQFAKTKPNQAVIHKSSLTAISSLFSLFFKFIKIARIEIKNVKNR